MDDQSDLPCWSLHELQIETFAAVHDSPAHVKEETNENVNPENHTLATPTMSPSLTSLPNPPPSSPNPAFLSEPRSQLSGPEFKTQIVSRLEMETVNSEKDRVSRLIMDFFSNPLTHPLSTGKKPIQNQDYQFDAAKNLELSKQFIFSCLGSQMPKNDKSCLNRHLYELQRQGLLEKVSDVPCFWKICQPRVPSIQSGGFGQVSPAFEAKSGPSSSSSSSLLVSTSPTVAKVNKSSKPLSISTQFVHQINYSPPNDPLLARYCHNSLFHNQTFVFWNMITENEKNAFRYCNKQALNQPPLIICVDLATIPTNVLNHMLQLETTKYARLLFVGHEVHAPKVSPKHKQQTHASDSSLNAKVFKRVNSPFVPPVLVDRSFFSSNSLVNKDESKMSSDSNFSSTMKQSSTRSSSLSLASSALVWSVERAHALSQKQQLWALVFEFIYQNFLSQFSQFHQKLTKVVIFSGDNLLPQIPELLSFQWSSEIIDNVSFDFIRSIDQLIHMK